MSAGLVPDLRYSAIIGDKKAWSSIVADGALTELGMVGFNEQFPADEIEAVRAYCIDRARATAH